MQTTHYTNTHTIHRHINAQDEKSDIHANIYTQTYKHANTHTLALKHTCKLTGDKWARIS